MCNHLGKKLVYEVDVPETCDKDEELSYFGRVVEG